MAALSVRAGRAYAEFEPVMRFFRGLYAQGPLPADLCDFTFGNPHEMPLPGLVQAIRDGAVPRNPDWFAYKTSETAPQAFLAERLSAELGLDFRPRDITLTQGAFAAIALAFHLLAEPGDEVIIPVPGWFCYAPMLRMADLVPVKVPLDSESCDPDLDAIGAAIGPRTAMVVVNSPANPTGRVIAPGLWDALAALLEDASTRIGRRIWLLSDEPYRRIRFDGIGFSSPAAHYPWTLIDYSYGKILLAPGQRLGYLALSPLMPAAERAELADAFFPGQMALGWTFPDAVMQYAVPALEEVGLDMAALTARRDRLCDALAASGYRIARPQGAFYLWCEAPGGDGQAFADRLAERGVRVMPGALFDRPSHFRVSLTATEDMIERALPAFRESGPGLRKGLPGLDNGML
jgi:aspartate/methionine/tyrosine aminotransferase